MSVGRSSQRGTRSYNCCKCCTMAMFCLAESHSAQVHLQLPYYGQTNQGHVITRHRHVPSPLCYFCNNLWTNKCTHILTDLKEIVVVLYCKYLKQDCL